MADVGRCSHRPANRTVDPEVGRRWLGVVSGWALFLASLALLVAPIYLMFSHLFTMNAFDPLLWTLKAWFLVDLVQTGNERNWIRIGVLVGVTLLNKYGVLFFIVGLLAGVALSGTRRSLARPSARLLFLKISCTLFSMPGQAEFFEIRFSGFNGRCTEGM
jgi:hypothetical protein